MNNSHEEEPAEITRLTNTDLDLPEDPSKDHPGRMTFLAIAGATILILFFFRYCTNLLQEGIISVIMKYLGTFILLPVLALTAYACLYAFHDESWKRSSFLRKTGITVLVLCGEIVLIFMIWMLGKSAVLDIPYLFHPADEVMYVQSLEIEDGENKDYYEVHTTDHEGNRHTFDIRKDTWEKADQYSGQLGDLKVHAVYLPNTDTVISIDFYIDGQPIS